MREELESSPRFRAGISRLANARVGIFQVIGDSVYDTSVSDQAGVSRNDPVVRRFIEGVADPKEHYF